MRFSIIRSFSVFLLAMAVLVSVFSGCAGKDEAEGTPLVRVGDSIITREEVEMTWNNLPENEKVRYRDRQGLQILVNNLVSLELLHQEALRQGLDKDPQIKRQIRKAQQNILVEEMITRSVKPADLYRMFQESFIRARAIQINFSSDNDPESDEAARRKINKIYQMVKKGEDFSELARDYSNGGFAERGGDLGYLSREMALDSFGFDAQEALFSLEKPNDFSTPVRGKVGYLIFQLMEKSGNLDPKGFDQNIGNMLFDSKSEEIFRGYVNELKSRTKIENYKDNLEEFLNITEQVNVTAPPAEEGETVPADE